MHVESFIGKCYLDEDIVGWRLKKDGQEKLNSAAIPTNVLDDPSREL